MHKDLFPFNVSATCLIMWMLSITEYVLQNPVCSLGSLKLVFRILCYGLVKNFYVTGSMLIDLKLFVFYFTFPL